MPRITIELPEAFAYRTELPICIAHINYGHHLDNVAFLTFVSEARVRFLKSMGYTEFDIEGVGIIMADAAVRYRSEAYHGEILVLEMTAQDFHEFGCDLVYRATEKLSGRNVAEGKTGIRFFDYTAKQKVPVPAAFRRRFA